ncbi:hypothetical protein HRR78_005181, partial [Exophiala dermatitidis]
MAVAIQGSIASDDKDPCTFLKLIGKNQPAHPCRELVRVWKYISSEEDAALTYMSVPRAQQGDGLTSPHKK